MMMSMKLLINRQTDVVNDELLRDGYSPASASSRCLGVVRGQMVLWEKDGFLGVWNVFVLFWSRTATVGRFGVTSSKTAWLLGREPPAHKCKSEREQKSRGTQTHG